MNNTSIPFKSNPVALTLGAEIELQVMDAESLELKPEVPRMIKELDNQFLTKELFQSMLEVITGVCDHAHAIENDLNKTLAKVDAYAQVNSLAIATTGSHPMADYNDRKITDTPRYHQLIDRNQWLSRRTSVYGLHVHIGMRSGDECVAFSNFFVRQLPVFLALSASSPFWIGKDSGLASTRPTVYEAIPTCGMPYLFNDWAAFEQRVSDLIRVRSITSLKDLWWDLRPSPGHGTLEIRICDGPASLCEVKSIVALIHVMAVWYSRNKTEFAKAHSAIPERWILRENKWKVIRHGLDADFICEKGIKLSSIRQYTRDWMERSRDIIGELGYENEMGCIENLMLQGNSSDRQRKVFERTGELMDVIRHNIREYTRRKPSWSTES